MTEAEARKAADKLGWKLEKRDKSYRLTTDNGTVIAGDWTAPENDYFGLSLADIGKALEP